MLTYGANGSLGQSCCGMSGKQRQVAAGIIRLVAARDGEMRSGEVCYVEAGTERKNMAIDLTKLAEPFPPEEVSWRAGPVHGNKTRPLAFLDARNIQDRLDDVCGPDGWCSEFTVIGPTTICRITILTDNGRIYKEDGAGQTDVEAEKGQLSDALKRCAVSWGVGRYLYAIRAPWVEFDTERKKIPDHVLEQLMRLLPNGPRDGLQAKTLDGQAKTPAKFWSGNSYNVFSKLPQDYKNDEGDPDWANPETMARLSEIIHTAIDKAPNKLALTKLQVDNMRWINDCMPTIDKEGVLKSFVIRADQFDKLVAKSG